MGVIVSDAVVAALVLPTEREIYDALANRVNFVKTCF